MRVSIPYRPWRRTVGIAQDGADLELLIADIVEVLPRHRRVDMFPYTGLAQAIEETIAVLVNPERRGSRDILKSEVGCNFPKLLYRVAGVVEPTQFN